MNESLRFIPGTDIDTAAASDTNLIAYPLLCATYIVKLPGLITIVHDLVAMWNGLRWTFSRAFAAFRAEILESKIYRLVDG